MKCIDIGRQLLDVCVRVSAERRDSTTVSQRRRNEATVRRRWRWWRVVRVQGQSRGGGASYVFKVSQAVAARRWVQGQLLVGTMTRMVDPKAKFKVGTQIQHIVLPKFALR